MARGIEEGRGRMDQQCAHPVEAGARLGDKWKKNHYSGPSEIFQVHGRASGEDGADGFAVDFLVFLPDE